MQIITLPSVLTKFMENLSETNFFNDAFNCISEKIYPTDCRQAKERIICKKAKSLKLMMGNCII